MHFPAEKVDSSREDVGACSPYEVADLRGSVQSPDFVPQLLVLASKSSCQSQVGEVEEQPGRPFLRRRSYFWSPST